MARSQGKNWCFTLNNYTQEEYDAIIAMDAKYYVVGKEVGAEGTPHLQGFVSLHVNHRLTAVKRYCSRAHWELAKGTATQNFTYCSKDGDFIEKGTRSLTRNEQRVAQQDTWRNFIAAAKNGTAEADYPREFVQYNGFVQRTYRPTLPTLDTYSGLWFMGAPGTGKSRAAREEYPGLYEKSLNRWWDGYEGEETILLDDLDKGASVWIGNFLKRWTDHYPVRVEVKGGSKVVRPKRVIVTSNYSIQTLFADQGPEMVAAIERRFTVREF